MNGSEGGGGGNRTHIFLRYTWTGFMEVHCPVTLTVDRTVTPVWYVIGVLGNVISAQIWLKKGMRQNNSSAVYLATLSITDLVFLLLHVLQELKYTWAVRSLSAPGVCEGYFVLSLCAQYLSPVLVLAFTVERFIAIVYPFKKERLCSLERAVKVVVGLVLLSLALSSMQGYLWTYQASVCDIRAEALVGRYSLWSVWTWTTEMLVFLVVPSIILLFNLLVIREVRRISQAGPAGGGLKSPNKTTTLMLLSVSFYVILTTLPVSIVYAISPNYKEGNPFLSDAEVAADPVWTRYLNYVTARKLIEEVCISHYACNIFLYLITGVHFRREFVLLIGCRESCGRPQYTVVSQIGHHSNDVTTTTRV